MHEKNIFPEVTILKYTLYVKNIRASTLFKGIHYACVQE